MKFDVGTRVKHITYGSGDVVKINCLSSCNLYKVKFDNTKETKMFDYNNKLESGSISII
jgi:hypothetical protein